MSAPDFRKFLLKNFNQADTVYPMVYDRSTKKALWDGSTNSSNVVGPGDQTGQTFDLSTIPGNPVPDQTVVLLGCKVQGSGTEHKDDNNPRTYIIGSTKTAVGSYLQNESFVLDSPPTLALDAISFQDAFINVNLPAVAQLLIALARVISPGITV